MEKRFGVMNMLLKSPSRSISTRLFLLFFCFATILAATVGFVSYRIASHSLIGQVKAGSEQTVTLAGEKLDMQQQFYLSVSNQLINNSFFIESLFQITSKELDVYEREKLIKAIQGLFDQLALSDSRIRDITLIPLEDSIPSISTIREALQADPSAEWIEPIRKSDGGEAWLPTKAKGYLGNAAKPLFAYGKLLGKRNIGSHDFMLLVQLESSILDEMIGSNAISPSATIAIMDASGQIITSNSGKTGILGDLTNPSARQTAGSSIVNDHGEDYIVAYRSSKLSGWTIAGEAPLDELTGAVKRIYLLTILSIGGGMIIAFLIGIWLIRSIGRPLVQMESLMSKAASGDFRGRLLLRGKDEIGKVSAAYNRMMQQISELVFEANHTVESVLVSSREMAESAANTARAAVDIDLASKQIASGAAGLVVNTESSNESVSLMGYKVAEALQLQNRMAESAQEVDSVCHQGESTMNGLIAKTVETEQRMITVGSRIEELKRSSHSIQEVLLLMKDMAKRIKILSLNAMIEASHAGVSGAGFKVIANEIGKLADQSNLSIGRVNELTANVQSAVSDQLVELSGKLIRISDRLREQMESFRVGE